MPTRRREPHKPSEPAPSEERPRSSETAPAGELRDAISVLRNVALLLRQPAPRAMMESIHSEVESAAASLRAGFVLSTPELAGFVEERLGALERAFAAARASGSWRDAIEPSAAIASDIAAATELLDLLARARGGTPAAQTLETIGQDLSQHWHPLVTEGTLKLVLTEEAALVRVSGDPRVVANLFGVITSIFGADVVTLSESGGRLKFEPGGDPSKGRAIPRLRLIPPTLEVARQVSGLTLGELRQRGLAVLVSLRA